jgi:hypothetical protein
VAIAKEAGFTITVEEALQSFWKIRGLLNSLIVLKVQNLNPSPCSILFVWWFFR